MRRKGHSWVFSILAGSLVAAVLFLASFYYAHLDYHAQQKERHTIVQQRLDSALRLYEKAIQLLLLRLRSEERGRLSKLLEKLQRDVPLAQELSLQERVSEELTQKPMLTFKGGGVFEDMRPLHPQKALQIRFSLKPLLAAFPDIHLAMRVPETLTPPLEIKKYVRVSSFSLHRYMTDNGFHIVHIVLIALLTMLLLGSGDLRFLLNRWRARQALRKKVGTLEASLARQDCRLSDLEKMKDLMENATTQKNRLIQKVLIAYQKMAISVETVHEVALTFLSENLESQAAERDSHRLLKSTKLPLSALSKGYPVGEAQENVDVTSLWKDTLTIFLPSFHAKNVTLHTTFPPKVFCTCDPLALQLLFYNILAQLRERFLKDNTLTIFCQVKKDIQLTFKDDGFTLRDELTHIPESGVSSIFSLHAKEISEFARSLGWRIDWGIRKKGQHLTTFYLPKEIETSSRVLRLKDFREKAI